MNCVDVDEGEGMSWRNKSSPRESDGVVTCPKSLTSLMILNETIVDHSYCYMKNILDVALKYENQVDLSTRWCKPTPISFKRRLVSAQLCIID